jgi:hypothetical protein
MGQEYPEDKDLEEFEKEFSMEKDHPLQVLGSWIIVLGCLAAIITWVLFLLEILRH